MFARAFITITFIATFARCVAATFACAPAPVVSTRAGVVETIPLGATDAADEDAPCRANASATYVVVTLPARGRLLDPRTLAPILAAPHVLPPGETTLAYRAPPDAFSLPFDADARTAAETPPLATLAFAACHPAAPPGPDRDESLARPAVVRVHVVADPPTASPAIDAFQTTTTTLEDVAADVFVVGSADPVFVAATGTGPGSGPGSGSGSGDDAGANRADPDEAAPNAAAASARDSIAVFLRVLVEPSRGWVYADGVLLRAGDVAPAAAGDACDRGLGEDDRAGGTETRPSSSSPGSLTDPSTTVSAASSIPSRTVVCAALTYVPAPDAYTFPPSAPLGRSVPPPPTPNRGAAVASSWPLEPDVFEYAFEIVFEDANQSEEDDDEADEADEAASPSAPSAPSPSLQSASALGFVTVVAVPDRPSLARSVSGRVTADLLRRTALPGITLTSPDGSSFAALVRVSSARGNFVSVSSAPPEALAACDHPFRAGDGTLDATVEFACVPEVAAVLLAALEYVHVDDSPVPRGRPKGNERDSTSANGAPGADAETGGAPGARAGDHSDPRSDPDPDLDLDPDDASLDLDVVTVTVSDGGCYYVDDVATTGCPRGPDPTAPRASLEVVIELRGAADALVARADRLGWRRDATRATPIVAGGACVAAWIAANVARWCARRDERRRGRS